MYPLKSEVTVKRYAFEYQHKGAAWLIEIHATSLEDAKQRLHKLPMSRPLGELVAKVPAAGGPLVKLVCWLRNLVA